MQKLAGQHYEKGFISNSIIEIMKRNTKKVFKAFELAEELKRENIIISIDGIRKNLRKLLKLNRIFKITPNISTLNVFYSLVDIKNQEIDFNIDKYSLSKEAQNYIIENSDKKTVVDMYKELSKSSNVTISCVYWFRWKNKLNKYSRGAYCFEDMEKKVLSLVSFENEKKVIYGTKTNLASKLNISRTSLYRLTKKLDITIKHIKKPKPIKVKEPKQPKPIKVKEPKQPKPIKVKEPKTKALKDRIDNEILLQEQRIKEKRLLNKAIKKEVDKIGFCSFSLRNYNCLNRLQPNQQIQLFTASGNRFLCSNCLDLLNKQG